MADESRVLEKAKQGDQQAIAHIVMRYQHMVRNYLYALSPDPFIADDLAQDVFVKFIGSIDRIDSKRGIKPYLMQMTRNIAIDHWRKLSRRKKIYHEALFYELEAYYQQRYTGNEDHTLSQQLDALKQCLNKLSDRVYRVILGFYYENLSCRELANIAGTSNSNIRTLLHRGRQALFKCIGKTIKKMALIK